MLKLAALLSVLVLHVALGQKTSEITFPDMIRNEYLKLEKTLWEKSVSRPKSQNEKLKKIYAKHNNYIATFLTESINIDNYKSRIGSHLWLELRTDFLNVHRLFVAFRQHIARATKNSEQDFFDEEASLDLSAHILNDPYWPLKESLQNLFKVTFEDKIYSVGYSSVHQNLYQLYKALAIVETEAYMMMQWAHMVRTVYQKGDSTSDGNTLRDEFENMTVECLQKLVAIFEKADRAVWRRDPMNHIENSTYLQITKFFQGHVENVKNLNEARSCYPSCSSFQLTTPSTGCSKGSVCNMQKKRCDGKLLYCRPVAGKFWLCPSSEKSLRRYEYLTYSDEPLVAWGQPKHCEQPGYHVSE